MIEQSIAFGDPRMPDRFWSKVEPEPNTGCWLWSGCGNIQGYGTYNHEGKRYGAHRIAYQILVGPIPPKLVMDHLCRVRCCVNPAHIEVTTNRANILRGIGLTAIEAKMTHCHRGHSLTGAYIRHRDGSRDCRECKKIRESQYRSASAHRARARQGL